MPRLTDFYRYHKEPIDEVVGVITFVVLLGTLIFAPLIFG